MARPIKTTLVFGALLALVATGHARTQAPPPLVSVYAAWLGGDYNAIASAFPTGQSFKDARADIQRTLRDWSRTWQPSHLAFLLELSVAAHDRQWEDAAELLGGTRNLLVNRRAAPGTRPEEDAFELAFHRAAVTLFLRRQALKVADAYLTALAGRVDLVQATSGKPRLVDPWLTFARGLIAEIQTAPSFRPLTARTGGTDTALAIAEDDADTRRAAELAIGTFERVREAPAVAAEASTRRGLLLLRIGRVDDALAAFDEADAGAGDEMVRYWSALFRGRALEQRGRHEQAAAAYERAAALAPSAQSPLVALASLWQRHDRPADAQRWARRAMSTPAGALDPWWVYWLGDVRHTADRLATIRSARP